MIAKAGPERPIMAVEKANIVEVLNLVMLTPTLHTVEAPTLPHIAIRSKPLEKQRFRHPGTGRTNVITNPQAGHPSVVIGNSPPPTAKRPQTARFAPFLPRLRRTKGAGRPGSGPDQ